MKVEIKKIDKLKRKIKVEVKGDELLKEKKEIYQQAAKSLKVPGFRPGSAPLDLLEKHHGKLLNDEFLRKVIPLFYHRALDENKILSASLPHISDLDLKADSLTFYAEFETKPEIQVDESTYKGIKIKDKRIEVKEIDIEKILTNLKEGIKKVIHKDFNDDEIAKWASYSDISSLREAIRGQLFVEKTRERRQRIDSQIREQLTKSLKIDLPKEEVERHHKELVNREISALEHRGISKEHLDKYRKEVESKLKPIAETEIKLFYVLEAIAKKEGIEINDTMAEVVFGFILSQAQYQK